MKNLQSKLHTYFKPVKAEKPAVSEAPAGLQLIEENLAHHPLNQGLTFQERTYQLGPGVPYKADDLLFLDVECVELGFGVNNTPYLIGLAYHEDNKLMVKQVFSQTPLVEEAALAFLDDFWQQFQYIVTYNGKSFDIPLIKSRFNLFRMQNPHAFNQHFDLYHIIRRIYSFERYRLVDSEKNLLALVRENDLPGAFSGQAYFEYLKHGDDKLLNQIMTHNLYDLVSLASLTQRLAHDIKASTSPTGQAPRKIYKYDTSYQGVAFLRNHFSGLKDLDGEDLFFLAHAYKKQKDYGRARRFYYQSYKRGYKKSLKPYLVCLYFYLKKPTQALQFIEERLPLEEFKYQEQMLQIKRRLNAT